MRQSSGFTLIELLVVISIIAVLAGLLMPAITLVKKKAHDIQCGNQLRQIGLAIYDYQSQEENSGRFPGRLKHIFLPSRGGSYARGTEKIAICPRDVSMGQDSNVGRMVGNGWTNYSYLQTAENTDQPGEPKMACSYLYETSETALDTPIGSGLINYFFRDRLTNGINNGSALPSAGSVTWFDGKSNQRSLGNLNDSNKIGAPFADTSFPIIRCFHHERWTLKNEKSSKKVLAVTWALNTMWCTPYWELDVTPDLANF